MNPVARRPTIAVARQIRELDAIVGKDCMQPIGHGCDRGFKEDDRCGTIGLFMQLDEGELRGSVDSNEYIEFAFLRPDFGNVDVEEADRVGLELFLRGRVAFNLRQPTDAMTLQAAMQGRACQMLDRGLKSIKTIVQRQQRVSAKGNDDRFFLYRKNRGSWRPGSGWKVGDRRTLLPLKNGLGVDVIACSKRSQALLTILYCSTDRLCRGGARVKNLPHSGTAPARPMSR